MSNPFSMARQLMKLGEDQGLDEGELQVLYNSGHLSRLFRAAKYGDLSQVNVEELERILGLDPSVFHVKLGGSENTDQIVVALREDGFWVNDYITHVSFPLKLRAVIEEVEIEIVNPKRSFSFDECPTILAEAKLDEPTYEHALRFAHQCGKATTSVKKPFVIFPHAPWLDPRRGRRVMSLRRSSENRKLYLHSADDRFYDGCVVAGVRPRKQSSAA